MIDLILWVLFGALAGWIASMIANTNTSQGVLGNIIVGLAGAVIGGFIVQALGGPPVSGISFAGLLVAVGGAVLLLFLYNSLTHRRKA